MPSWLGVFDSSTDWSAQAFIDMFNQAVWERQRATQNRLSAGGPSYTYSPINVGDDVQLATLFSGWQSTISSIASRNANGGGWLKVAPSALALTPYSTIGSQTWNGLSDVMTSLGYSAGTWTRKRPREISNTSSTSDTQGNARATNQVALNLADGLIYKFNGSAWVATIADPIDLLSSTSAAPNAVSAGGTMQAGDYIGPWIFTELRDVIHALGASYLATDGTTAPFNNSLKVTTNAGTKYGRQSAIYNTGNPTADTASAVADALGGPSTGSPTISTVGVDIRTLLFGTNQYEGEAMYSPATFTTLTPAHLARDVMTVSSISPTFGSGDYTTFDPQNDSFVAFPTGLFRDQTNSTGYVPLTGVMAAASVAAGTESATSGTFGNAPTNYDVPTLSVNTYNRGYQFGVIDMIVTWGFTNV